VSTLNIKAAIMSRLDYRFHQSPIIHYVDQVLAVELLWPIPLITVGLLQIMEPLAIGIALLLALLPWLTRWLLLDRSTRPTYLGGALALFVGSALIGIWASYEPNLSWPLFFTLLGSIAFFFAVANTRTSPRHISSILVIGAALFAGYFVSQYGHFIYLTEIGRLANLARATGSLLPDMVFFTPHPNAAAGFLEGTLLLSLVLLWRAKSGGRIAWGVMAALIAYGLLISGSRGSWLGLAVAGAIWLLWLTPKRGAWFNMVGISLGMGLGAVLGLGWLIWQGGSIPAVASIINTAASRLTLYRNSLYLWSDYPFTGIGLGDTFAMVYSRYQLLLQVPFLTYSHNMFLSVTVGLGILGLIALIWLILSFYTFVIRVERAGLSEPDQTLFRAAWLGATVTFVHGLTDAPQFAGSGWTMPMLFGLLGLSVALGSQVLQQKKSWEVERKALIWNRPTLVTAGILVAIVAVGVIGFWRPLLSAWYVNLGALDQTRADLTPNLDDSIREDWMQRAVAHFNEALTLEPLQPAANRRLGLLAFNREDYDTAIVYLKLAHQQETANQATIKALGYAYMWTGQLDEAEKLLRQIDNPWLLIYELKQWSGHWQGMGQPALADYAATVAQRLAALQ
jgi:O-antigen ligase